MGSERDTWEAVGESWGSSSVQLVWRKIHNAINQGLLDDWRENSVAPMEGCAKRALPAFMLKTDLFDEATNSGLLRDLDVIDQSVVGMDLSLSVCQHAGKAVGGGSEAYEVTNCDVRRLPFADGSFTTILSNSTLDHFDHYDELEESLRELRRTLAEGGQLILTMDNRANPVVALRNALPFALVHRLGLVPYPVGATAGPGKLQRTLSKAGFEVQETRALSHFPRVLGVWLAAVVEWLGGARAERFLRRTVLAAEVLEFLPTRFLTGYYVAIRATASARSQPEK